MGVVGLTVDTELARYLLSKPEILNKEEVKTWANIQSDFAQDKKDGLDPNTLPALTQESIKNLQDKGFVSVSNAKALNEQVSAQAKAANNPVKQAAWDAKTYDPNKNTVGQASALDKSVVLGVSFAKGTAPNGEIDFKSSFNLAAGVTGADALKLAPLPQNPTLADRSAQLLDFGSRAGILNSTTKSTLDIYLNDKDGSILQRQRDFAVRMCPNNDGDDFLKKNFAEFERGLKDYQTQQTAEQSVTLGNRPAPASQTYNTDTNYVSTISPGGR